MKFSWNSIKVYRGASILYFNAPILCCPLFFEDIFEDLFLNLQVIRNKKMVNSVNTILALQD